VHHHVEVGWQLERLGLQEVALEDLDPLAEDREQAVVTEPHAPDANSHTRETLND